MLTMSARRLLTGVVAVGVFALLPATASAQAVRPSGEIEFGTRQLFGDLASSKFLEYRSIPEGPFLNRLALDLDWSEEPYYLSLRANDALEGDQSVQAGAGRYGRFAFTFRFDKTPHLFSKTARSIYTEATPGVFALPVTLLNRLLTEVQNDLRTILTTDTDPGTGGVQPDLAALNALVEGLARPVAVDLVREKGTATVRYTPSPGWDVEVQYSLENQRGARPFGATFAFSPTEQAEPIDYKTHDIRASVERSGKNWTVQVGYRGSIFRNDADVLVFDNPFRATDAPGNPSRGRIALYPDNTAHQGTLSGAVNLPLRTRWTASAAYGVFSQDDPFQPFTINDSVANVPPLPAASADARIETLLFNSTLTTRPVPDLAFTVRYRVYDRNNDTPSLLFPGYVRTDQLVPVLAVDTLVQRRNLPLAYTRQDAGVEASWRIVGPLAARVGYEWEGWEREHRETRSTDENTVRGAVDVSHRGWLFLRVAYRRSDRNGHDYDPHRVAEETFPAGEPGLGQLESLRKFDQADRQRDRAELIARLSPGEKVSVSASYSLTDDAYDDSEYGLLESRGRSPAVELSYSFVPRLTLFAEYAQEDNRWNMRSRQRSPTNDKPDNDWLSDIRDRVNTYSVGLSGEPFPERVQLDLTFTLSDGSGRTRTSTPGTPDLVTTAEDYPQIVSDLKVLNATVWYHFGRRVAARLDYRFEEYDQADFALDPMTSFMGIWDAASAGTAWLGATRPDYRAHVASVSLAYRF